MILNKIKKYCYLLDNNILHVKQFTWLRYSLVFFLAICIYWMSFFPAIMSFDSVAQWNQILTGKFSDYHPAFHTISMWWLTRAWQSPSIITFAQILFFSIVSGWGFSILQEDLKIPEKIIVILCVLYALSPVNGIWVVTLWKDIPYSVAILAITLMLLKMLLTKGQWLEKNWIGLAIVALPVTFFRHNGPVVSFGLLILLLLVYRKQFKYLLAVLLFLIFAWVTIKGPIYSFFNVTGVDNADPTRVRYGMAPVVSLVAAHVVNGTPLALEEQSFIKQLHPENNWDSFYTCYSVVSVMDTNNINWDPIYASPSTILRLAYSLTLKDPLVSIANVACRSDFVWDIPQGKNVMWSLLASIEPLAYPDYFYIYNLNPDFIAPLQRPFLPLVGYTISKYFSYTAVGILKIIVWRPALYLYAGMIALSLFVIKRRRLDYYLLLVPILLHTGSIMLSAGAQDLRYQYPVYLVFWILVGLPWSKREV